MSKRTRPTVTISYAQTLDGRAATRWGESQWIGGGASLVYAHTLRAEHDAIMIGANTVARDDPRLTVRLVPGRDPLRVVVDSALRTSIDAAVLSPDMARGTLIAVTEAAPSDRVLAARERGATVLRLPADAAGRVDLPALLDALHRRGVGSVMVEGGATLITALLRLRVVDRAAICVAPRIMGAGLDGVGDLGIDKLSNMLHLHNFSIHRLGDDLLWDGRIDYGEAGDE